MDKGLFIYILIGFAFFYVVTNFVGDLQREDDRYRNNDYKEVHQYDKYQGTDSVGQSMLKVEGLDFATQKTAWQKSPLKTEWVSLFPDFSAMKDFVNQRVQGKLLEVKLNNLADEAEDKYFSGQLNTEQVKQMLDSLN